MGLMRPVQSARVSSWTAHQHRNPPSTEPGTDFYCPIGTPVYAPETGRVYGYGNSITPATGRWVGLDLVTGQRFRAMHFSQQALSSTILNGGFVRKGDIIGYSGASGYGEEDWSGNPNTGGAHCHVTLWPTHQSLFGYHWVDGKKVPYTVDIMNYIGDAAGGGSTPVIPEIELETDQMIPLYVTDSVDGNGVPGWALLNPRTGKVVPMKANNETWATLAQKQEIADSWGRVWGSAKHVTRLDMLNAIDAIQKTL